MINNQTFTVKDSGVRLDAALLLAYPNTTRAFVRNAIQSGDVLVNNKNTSKGMKLRAGDVITIKSILECRDNLVQPNSEIDLTICYEDDAILALDKKPLMPVQPLVWTETTTLMNGVVARYPACATLGDRPLMAGAIHRIDANTSGLVLVAKTADSFDAIRAQFSAQSVKKTYLALVEGEIAVGGTLENDLIHDPTVPFCRMIDAHHNRLTRAQLEGARALHAVTSFKPIARTMVENEVRTLLEVVIYTGVTHQIRAQLALAGIHIINDRLYGAFAVENEKGHCLHSFSADFIHPISGERIIIQTQYPIWARLF